jgi:hypothetical protein
MSPAQSQVVQRLIEKIEAALPANAVDRFTSLSPGQQALAEAVVHLQYGRLLDARIISERALGDLHAPGDEWVNDLLADMDAAIKNQQTGVWPWAWFLSSAAATAYLGSHHRWLSASAFGLATLLLTIPLIQATAVFNTMTRRFRRAPGQQQ